MSRQPKKSKAPKFEHLQGVISIHPNGYGFMQPEDSSAEEIFIPPSRLGNALPGDKVQVRLRPGRPQKGKREGAVVKVLERKVSELFGFFNGNYVVPRDERILNWFFVAGNKKKNAVAGDMVRALITVYPDAGGRAEAEIVEILGKEMTPKLESRIILRQCGFPEEFSSKAQAELAAIPEWVRDEDGRAGGRVDLSHIPFVTIDPVDAKDFDDAVAVKKGERGFKLWVAIADVSHYVVSGSEIDSQAYGRATSVYFPDRAIPMLPEPISAGIASLKPEENRLAMVAEMDYDLAGKLLNNKFYPALIKSRFRMNYQEVQAIFDGEAPGPAFKYEPVVAMLWEMSSLAKLLQQARKRRGSIDLDLPEARIELDEKGEPKDVYPYPRLFAHRLVEEFMLQANQSVAEFLTGKKMAFPFRIHEPPAPDKIQELNEFVSSLGFPLLSRDRGPHQIRPRDFQNLIDKASRTPLSGLISYLALRAMMQAKYSPENKGHFGLASTHYCHFTSPIRRYPDLMVHRELKKALGFGPMHRSSAPEDLSAACEHCSEREHAATSAEREMSKVYQARLMSRNLGKEFKGKISGMIDAGVFVEIERPMCEGLIPASKLPGYEYHAKLHSALVRSPRMELHLGDQVMIQVESVNLEYREVNFRLLGVLESAFTRPAQSLIPEPKKRDGQKSGKKGKRPKHSRRQ